MTVCKIDHDAELAIPRFLCQTCNPKTRLTRAEIDTAEAKERAEAKAERVKRSTEMEIMRLELKAQEIRKRKPQAGSVADKEATAIERKIKRLKAGNPIKRKKRT